MSSVCRSLQWLISALTQGGEGGLLFRITCSVMLWGGRNTVNKYHWHVGSAHSVWTTLGLPLLTAYVLSQSTLLSLQVALQGNCLRQALGCVHFPGLSCSGSGSLVFHECADLVGPAFCALPRSELLRRPAAWRAHSPQVQCILSPLWSWPLSFLGAQWECCLSCVLCLLWGADLWL